jgi:hypothetical protein
MDDQNVVDAASARFADVGLADDGRLFLRDCQRGLAEPIVFLAANGPHTRVLPLLEDARRAKAEVAAGNLPDFYYELARLHLRDAMRTARRKIMRDLKIVRQSRVSLCVRSRPPRMLRPTPNARAPRARHSSRAVRRRGPPCRRSGEVPDDVAWLRRRCGRRA